MSSKVSIYVPPAENARRCCFCGSFEDDELKLGKFYKYNGIVTHYYCLLLSSNMQQRGEDDEGILGFLTEDINKELKRGKRLNCSYCKKNGATLGCCNSKCKTIFHLPCGLRTGSLHQFFGEFRSFCAKHRPRQRIDSSVLSCSHSLDSTLCYICYEATNPQDLRGTLWAPCCKKNAWFHRECVQRLAMSAGYFFKCPLCNNKGDFQKAMLDHGIFIPSQDASWELVPNAFEELLYRHNRCDAEECLCPKGREHTSTNARWELTLCRTCGSQGIHMACGKLKWVEPVWECAECVAILEGTTSRSSGQTNRDGISTDDENQTNYDENCDSEEEEEEETMSRDSGKNVKKDRQGNTNKMAKNHLDLGKVEKLRNCEDEDCELNVCDSAESQSEDETRDFYRDGRSNRSKKLRVEKSVERFVIREENADFDHGGISCDTNNDSKISGAIYSEFRGERQDFELETEFVIGDKIRDFDVGTMNYDKNRVSESRESTSNESKKEIRYLDEKSRKTEATNEIMIDKRNFDEKIVSRSVRIESRDSANGISRFAKAANVIDKTQKLNEISDLEVWDSIKHLSEGREYKINDVIEEEEKSRNEIKRAEIIKSLKIKIPNDCQLICSGSTNTEKFEKIEITDEKTRSKSCGGFVTDLSITEAFGNRLKPGPSFFKLRQVEYLRKNLEISIVAENREKIDEKEVENSENSKKNENPEPESKKPRIESISSKNQSPQTNDDDDDDEIVVLCSAHGNPEKLVADPENEESPRESMEIVKTVENSREKMKKIVAGSSGTRDTISTLNDDIEILETINGNSKDFRSIESPDMNIKITNVTSLAPEAFTDVAGSKNSENSENVKKHDKLEIVRFELPAPLPGNCMLPVIYGLTLPGTNHTVPLIISTLPTEKLGNSNPPIYRPTGNCIPDQNSNNSVVYTSDGRIYGQSTTVDGQSYVFPAIASNSDRKSITEQRNLAVKRSDTKIIDRKTNATNFDSYLFEGNQVSNLRNAETIDKSRVKSKNWTVPLKGIFEGNYSGIYTDISETNSQNGVNSAGDDSFEERGSLDSNSGGKIKSGIDSTRKSCCSAINSLLNSNVKLNSSINSGISGTIGTTLNSVGNSNENSIKNTNSNSSAVIIDSSSNSNAKSTVNLNSNTNSNLCVFEEGNRSSIVANRSANRVAELDIDNEKSKKLPNFVSNESATLVKKMQSIDRTSGKTKSNERVDSYSKSLSEKPSEIFENNRSGEGNSTNFDLSNKTKRLRVNKKTERNSNVNFVVKLDAGRTNFVTEIDAALYKRIESESSDSTGTDDEINAENPTSSQHKMRLLNGVESSSYVPISELKTSSATNLINNENPSSPNLDSGQPTTTTTTTTTTKTTKNRYDEPRLSRYSDADPLAEIRTRKRHQNFIGIKTNSDRRNQRIFQNSDGDAGSRPAVRPTAKHNGDRKKRGGSSDLDADDESAKTHEKLQELSNSSSKRRSVSNETFKKNVIDPRVTINGACNAKSYNNCASDRIGLIKKNPRLRDLRFRVSGPNLVQMTLYDSYIINIETRSEGNDKERDFRDAQVFSYDDKLNMSSERTKRLSRRRYCKDNCFRFETSENVSPLDVGAKRAKRLSTENPQKIILIEDKIQESLRSNETTSNSTEINDKNVVSMDDDDDDKNDESGGRDELKENLDPIPTTAQAFNEIKTKVRRRNEGIEKFQKLEAIGDEIDGNSRNVGRNNEGNVNNIAKQESINDGGGGGGGGTDENSGKKRPRIDENKYADKQNGISSDVVAKLRTIRRKKEVNQSLGKEETIGQEINGKSKKNLWEIEGNEYLRKGKSISSEIDGDSRKARREIDETRDFEKHQEIFNEIIGNSMKVRRRSEGNENFKSRKAISNEIDGNFRKNREKSEKIDNRGYETSIRNEIPENLGNSLGKKRSRRSSTVRFNNFAHLPSNSMEFSERILKKRRISVETETKTKKINSNDCRLKNEEEEEEDDDEETNAENTIDNRNNLKKIRRKNWKKHKNHVFPRKVVENEDKTIDSQPSLKVSLDLTRIREIFAKNPPKKLRTLKNAFLDEIGVNFDEISTSSSLKIISKRWRSLNDLALPRIPLFSKNLGKTSRKSTSFENFKFPAKNNSFKDDDDFRLIY